MQGMVPSVEHLGSLLPSLRLATLGTYSYEQVWEGTTRCSVVGSWLPVQGSRSPSHQSTTPRKGRQARREVPGCAGTSRLPLSNGRRHAAQVPKPPTPRSQGEGNEAPLSSSRHPSKPQTNPSKTPAANTAESTANRGAGNQMQLEGLEGPRPN